MGGYPTGPEECAPPECEPRVTSLRDPGPIAVFVFWGVVVAYLALYFLVKLVRARRYHVPSTRLDLVAPSSSGSIQTDKARQSVSCRTKDRLWTYVCNALAAVAHSNLLCSQKLCCLARKPQSSAKSMCMLILCKLAHRQSLKTRTSARTHAWQ